MRDLRSFLEAVRQRGELAVIDAPVDPYLEIAEIHRRVIAENGPVLLFTNVKGSPFPVVTNLFGTSARVDLAFGPRPEQFMKTAVNMLHELMPPTFGALWKQRGFLGDLLKVGTKKTGGSAAPVRAVRVTDNPIQKLPALTLWPEDGGPFVTLPLVYTEHPKTHEHNLGMYRMQVYDGATTGMHWQIHKGGGFHYHAAEVANQPFPVTVFLGGPPALIASAIAPVPEPLPELMLTSLILGQKLAVTDDPFGPHRLVADAEFAICGHVPPHVRRPEGPFGDHYGYYSLVHDFPVFNISHMWHRKDAIYPATVVGKPKQEDYYLGEFLQRLLSPAFPMAMPGVRDLWTYAESGFHPLAAAVVRESYKREGLAHAMRILGEGQLTLTKVLIVTDQDVPLMDFPRLLTTLLERLDPRKDIFILNRTAIDTLDYTGDRLNHGSKMILLGTGAPVRQLPGEYTGGEVKEVRRIETYVPGCLVVDGPGYEADPLFAARLVESAGTQWKDWPLVFVVDDARETVRNQEAFLWTIFMRFNPAMDVYAKSEVRQHHLDYQFPLIIDARMKPGYPGEVIAHPDTVSTVDRRWHEYFPHGWGKGFRPGAAQQHGAGASGQRTTGGERH